MRLVSHYVTLEPCWCRGLRRPRVSVSACWSSTTTPGFRDSLVSLLDTDELMVVGQAGNGAQALELFAATRPDVVLMDVRMPTMDGIETTRRLKALDPNIGIVALTGLEDQRAVRDMLVAGASGYVLKDSDGDEILNAVREAASGGGIISPQLTPTVIEELTEALERERRRTRQFEIAQEALLERAASRHELVSRLGHELRTPVTVILGMAQTLAGGTAPEEAREELLDRLVARAQRPRPARPAVRGGGRGGPDRVGRRHRRGPRGGRAATSASASRRRPLRSWPA